MMMLSNFTALASLVVAVSGLSAPSGNTTSTGSQPAQSNSPNKISAHPDGQCQNGLSSSAKYTFEVNRAQGFPNYTTIQQPEFPGAEAKNGSGWDVWWSIPQPDAGCRFLMMLPFRQSSGTPGLPGGNEIINAGRGGCFFGNIPTDSDVLLSYCCGSDQCTRASLNSTSLLSIPQRRNIASQKSQTVPHLSMGDKLTNLISRIPTSSIIPKAVIREGVSTGGSSAAKAGALVSRYWYEAPPAPPPAPDCKVVKPGQPYSRAGQQIVVSSSQACVQSPCNVALSFQVTSSTTATSSKEQTITTSAGRSMTLAEGVDFLGGIIPEFKTGISRAVAESTGQEIMSGNSSTITNTVSLKLGNRGVVTFTPVYRCITGPLDCGDGISDPIDFCQPDLSGPGGSPLGDYYPLISD